MELVASATRPLRLAELAPALGAPKTSVHGLVRGLAAAGWLAASSGGYVVGPAVGALLGGSGPAVGAGIRPVLEALRDRCGETVILSAQVGASVADVDIVESAQLIRYAAPLHRRRPIWPTSTGKAFLAQLPVERRDALLRELVAGADLDAARAELDRARAEGVAYNRGETVPDVTAVAARLAVPGHGPLAVAVIGPTHRMVPRLAEHADAVRAAVTSVTSVTGPAGRAAQTPPHTG